MPFSPIHPHAFQFQNAFAPFLHSDGLPFAEVLEPAHVEQLCAEHQVCFGRLAKALWTPALTVWAFLGPIQ
jgi:hypothetical protein